MWSIFKAITDNTAALRQNAADVDSNTHAQQLNASASRYLASAVIRLTGSIDRLCWLVAKLIDQLRNLPDPGPISILVTGEFENMLVFNVPLPAEPEGADIASGELTITIGSAEQQTIATTKGQTEVVGLKGAQDALVTASFAYIDDSGNRSVHPSKIDAVPLKDTIPPPDPGALGIVVTGEEADPA